MKSYNTHNNPLWENIHNNYLLNSYENWLQRKNLTDETIQNKLRHIKKFGNQKLNTDSIVRFLRINSRYSPYHLENLRNSLGSYAKFLKIYEKIEWGIVNKLIPRIQPKFFPTIDHSDLAKLKMLRIWNTKPIMNYIHNSYEEIAQDCNKLWEANMNQII